MKLKSFLSIALSAGIAFSLSSGAIFASDIPEDIQQMVAEKVENSQEELPEVRAWEEDLDGNITEVTPLSVRESMRVPSDGYVYSFDHYDPDYVKRNYYYKTVSVFRVKNELPKEVPAEYRVEESKTIKWNVTGNVSGKTTIGNGFLAGVEASGGISVGREKTWSRGWSMVLKPVIPAKSIAYITNYQVGADTNGRLVYRKYSPSGTSWIGNYYESAGGTVINKDDINIELTETEPLR